jgi:hypothetical protein
VPNHESYAVMQVMQVMRLNEKHHKYITCRTAERKNCKTAELQNCKTAKLFIDLGPGIFQRYCSVKDEIVFRGIVVDTEISQPLELKFVEMLC